MESCPAACISTELLKLVGEWKINLDRFVAAVTDNGINVLKFVYDLFWKNWHAPRFEHTLNLMYENPISKTQGLSELLITKVRLIVAWFKRSVQASDMLRK